MEGITGGGGSLRKDSLMIGYEEEGRIKEVRTLVV